MCVTDEATSVPANSPYIKMTTFEDKGMQIIAVNLGHFLFPASRGCTHRFKKKQKPSQTYSSSLIFHVTEDIAFKRGPSGSVRAVNGTD